MSPTAPLSPGARLAAMRAAAPLVHNITNYVAMNVMANVLLAAGASPAPAQRAAAWSQEVEGRKGGTPAERGGHPISAPPPGSRTVHWPWPWMIAMGVITVLFLAAAAIV